MHHDALLGHVDVAPAHALQCANDREAVAGSSGPVARDKTHKICELEKRKDVSSEEKRTEQ